MTTAAAAYAVEVVKKVEPACGGNTQAGAAFVDPHGSNQASLGDPECLRFILNEIVALEGPVKEDWTRRMSQILKISSEKWSQEKAAKRPR